MAVGFGPADGVQDTIQATIDNAIDFARSQIRNGESLTHCFDCGDPIPEKRRAIVKGCRYCIECQKEHDEMNSAGYNRRGSKDSQLR